MSGEPKYELKDSGERQEFQTGARRDTQKGKGRFDLVSPVALERLAKWLELGATKYGDRNWEKGIPLSRYMDSALRHLNKYLAGMRDEDHLAAAAFNVFGLIHTERQVELGYLPESLDDLPNFHTKPPQPPKQLEFDFEPARPLRVYVSGPFSPRPGDPPERHDAIRNSNREAAEMVSRAIAALGHLPHCPHAATHFLEGHMGYEDFMSLDLALLGSGAFDALAFIGPSPGANRELELAVKLGLKIITSLDQLPNVKGTPNAKTT